jgi:hypothetical protein
VQQSPGQRRSGGDHMLAGVQQQHEPPVGERLCHARRRNLPAAKLEPDRRGHRGGNQAGISERCELGQPHAVGEVRQ